MKQRKPTQAAQARAQEVMRLSSEGLKNTEIAAAVGVSCEAVSNIRKRLGISDAAPLRKLWRDVDSSSQALAGVAFKFEELSRRVQAEGAVGATEVEVRKCVAQMNRSLGSIKALRQALRELLAREEKSQNCA